MQRLRYERKILPEEIHGNKQQVLVRVGVLILVTAGKDLVKHQQQAQTKGSRVTKVSVVVGMKTGGLFLNVRGVKGITWASVRLGPVSTVEWWVI